MKYIGQILIILVALIISWNGLATMINPQWMAEWFSQSPDGMHGISTLRAFFGGAMSAVGLSLLISVIKKEGKYALAAVLFLILVTIGRLVSLAMDAPNFSDGYAFHLVTYPIGPLVLLCLLIVGLRLMKKTNHNNGYK